MFALLAKIQKVRELYQAGNYQEAAHLVWQLVGDLMGYNGVSATADGADARDRCEAEAEAFAEDCKHPVRGAAQPVGAGGALALLLIQTFGPLIVELIRKRFGEEA